MSLYLLYFIVFTKFVQCMICTVDNINGNIEYPNAGNYNYGINFNNSLNQPNYVYYLANDNISPNKCIKYEKDPHNINTMTQNDYKYLSYVEGNLVPNICGVDVCYMSNIVPLDVDFNNGVWNNLKNYINNRYKNYLVVIGCKYDYSHYFGTHLDKTLYIPLGCYYIVFEILKLPQISTNIHGNVISHGYYSNSDDVIRKRDIPYWIKCDNFTTFNNINKDTCCEIKNDYNTFTLAMGYTLLTIIVIVCVASAYLIYLFYKK